MLTIVSSSATAIVGKKNVLVRSGGADGVRFSPSSQKERIELAMEAVGEYRFLFATQDDASYFIEGCRLLCIDYSTRKIEVGLGTSGEVFTTSFRPFLDSPMTLAMSLFNGTLGSEFAA